ncbi:pectin acetylesterase 5-like [Panicum virgatum]|uniref:pectin acetylesterase 5-like n=1 Tax=Panicum virgatum TaxID=38727 RepID=UPI0019D52AF2|nr:pectin acetylesterase 5-like [Panicum virgatum]
MGWGSRCWFGSLRLESSRRIHTRLLQLALPPILYHVQNVVVPDSSSPDESWRRRRADIRSCNSSQIQVLNGFRKAMVDGLKAVGVNKSCSWFIDSCFIHCQAWFDNSLQ